MHKRLIINIISRILAIISLTMLIPLVWALIDDPQSREVLAFSGTIIGGLLFSFTVLFLTRVKPEEMDNLNAKDGIAVVGLAWICASAYGAIPFMLTGAIPSFTDAFFETVSGFTTTGATVVTQIESLSRGILFWRSFTHWLGGMGIVLLSVALLPAFGRGAFQLYRAEVPGPTAERLQPRIIETAKILWTVYLLLSLAETLLLMLGGMPFFDALCHTFGTMATGGFSTKQESIGYYGPYIQWVVILFMFLAGGNFVLHYQVLTGRKLSAYFKSEEFRLYFFIVIVVTVFFTGVLIWDTSIEEPSPLREAAFQVVSILTTTGYCTANSNIWPHMLRLSLIVLMFIGGCAGSTGGGMKVIRVYVAMKVALRNVLQAISPNAVMPVKIDSAAVPNRLLEGVMAYFLIFISLFCLGSVVLTITERCDLITAFSASIACLGNIGPGLNKVGATVNYEWISVSGKWILSILMLAGRLELYSILILFLPSTWRR